MMQKLVRNIFYLSFLIISISVTGQQKVEWLSLKEALVKSQKEPRKIFVDVYTDWCGYCKKMDQSTFKDSLVTNYIANEFYPVKFNAEQKESVTIGDKTYNFVPNGRRGYHELAFALLGGRMAYPSIVFLDETGKLVERAPGFSPPPKFEAYLKYINEEHYKETSFALFAKKYKTPYTQQTNKIVKLPGH